MSVARWTAEAVDVGVSAVAIAAGICMALVALGLFFCVVTIALAIVSVALVGGIVLLRRDPAVGALLLLAFLAAGVFVVAALRAGRVGRRAMADGKNDGSGT